MSSIYDWSTTAANNATADGSINWAEGQAPSTVNNSGRQMMGRNAELVKDIGGSLTAGGTADALTVTANSAFSAYANGIILAFTAASDNTTAATLNVNSIGAKAIRKMTTSGDSALTGAEIQAGGIYIVQYSTAANSSAGGWILVNPTGIPAATTTSAGGVELATDAEAIARSDTSRAITPSNLAAAIGPASSTDNAIARFDGTSGKFQDSGVTIDDSNVISATVAAAGTALSLASTDSGVSGLDIGLYKNSASPAASDELARIIGLGNDSGGNQTVYSYLIFRLLDPTNGSEDGAFEIHTVKAGAAGQAVYFDRTANSITGNTTINGTLTVTG